MIEKDERLPLYYQLMDTILGQIENGEYKEHEKLPSERELCDRFNISRTTVRQTMQELEKEGYIYRKHGKGSFVSSKMFNQSLVQFYSFTEETIKMGKIPASKVLSFERILSDNKIAKKLNVQFEEEVYKIVRLRLANDEPMLYEVTYLPVSRFENLSRKELEITPMYDIFRGRYQVNITRASESFKAVASRKDEAENLDIQEGSPCLLLTRTTYEHSYIIEYTVTVARGDKFTYTVDLK